MHINAYLGMYEYMIMYFSIYIFFHLAISLPTQVFNSKVREFHWNGAKVVYKGVEATGQTWRVTHR